MASTPGIAVPGTPVPANAEVSPGGAQGTAGTSAGVATSQQTFTVPAVGQTQTLNVSDASSFLPGEMIYLDQAGGGPGQPGILQITAKAGNQVTLLNPTPAPQIPLASATRSGLLAQLSGKTSDFVGGDNACHALAASLGGPLAFLSAAYNLTVGDSNKYFICSGGSWALGLPAPVAGLIYRIRNDQTLTSGTVGTITITPSSGSNIDGGLTSLALLGGQEVTLFTDGTSWRSFGRNGRVNLGNIDLTGVTSAVVQKILLQPGYRSFDLSIINLVITPIGSALQAQLSFDGGNTFNNSANYQEQNNYNNAATTLAAAVYSNLTFFYITAGQYPNEAVPGHVKVQFYPGTSSSSPSFLATSLGFLSTSVMTIWTYGGYFNQQLGRANALQLYAPSGATVLGGQITVEGIV